MDKIKNKTENELIATRDELLEGHTRILRDEDLPPIDRQRSMDAVAKMQGYNEPEKVQTEVSLAEDLWGAIKILKKE